MVCPILISEAWNMAASLEDVDEPFCLFSYFAEKVLCSHTQVPCRPSPDDCKLQLSAEYLLDNRDVALHRADAIHQDSQNSAGSRRRPTNHIDFESSVVQSEAVAFAAFRETRSSFCPAQIDILIRAV